MSLMITAIPAFDDNYIWCLTRAQGNLAWVVDPGEAEPVLTFLQQHQLQLAGVLVTHHHSDHTGGIEQLKARFDHLAVWGPDNPQIPGITRRLSDNEQVTLPELNAAVHVIEVPGHTLDHLAYLCEGNLLCGDTLFSGGCGRMFEGTPEQFTHSLGRLAALPLQTQVYCAHEYTQSNLRFARAVDGQNPAIAAYQQECDELRLQGYPTLPSSIAKELSLNPFLRLDDRHVRQALTQHWEQQVTDTVGAFALLRRWKDNF
ncbi:MAG: hydroxyacylglutathione hydrolase [Shewanella sp.]|nr:hydroxyacylglutathione hydrolase [Shewanella sp.]MCF1429660.1 hydroxyacylglutathione hydrolase [Shewanella sp.]MCF1437414.1 hydroxyacylglutathione hydrolase [Shewanella sp.]